MSLLALLRLQVGASGVILCTMERANDAERDSGVHLAGTGAQAYRAAVRSGRGFAAIVVEKSGFRRHVPYVKVRDAIRAVERDGWIQVRQRGSHRQYHHPVKAGTVTVAGQPPEDVPTGTLKNTTKDEIRGRF